MLAVVFVYSLFVPVNAAVHDPYEGIRCANYDAATNTTNSIGSGFISNSGYNQVYTYKNVDFGSIGAHGVTVETATAPPYVGAIINIYLDSTDNKPIATFTVRESGWGVPLGHYVELATKVTGIHTVLLKTGSKATDFYSIRFHESVLPENSYKEYQATADPFADIADSKHREDIVLLWELGLIQTEVGQDMYYPELLTTRGKFVETLVRCLTDVLPNGEEQVFTDVAPDNEYFDAINYAKTMGIINGMPDGRFCPDEFILAKDAVSLVCRMLGYDVLAYMNGGYAEGYLKIATQYDILDGIEMSEYLTRGSMAALIRNAIAAPCFDVSAIRGDAAEYTPSEDGILAESYDIYYDKGLVVANNVSGISQPDSGIEGNYVTINGEDYKAGDSLARALLGYECDFYYKKDNDEKTIISIHPQKKVEVTELSSEVYDFASITAQNVVYYDEKNKEKKIEIGNDCYILYNGVAADSSLSDLIATNPFRGKIRFVKNPKAKNTLMIEEYKNILIGGASKRDLFIYDAIQKKHYSFNEDDFVYMYRNGTQAQYLDMQDGDVAMVYESKNKSGGRIFRIYATNATETGKVTVVNDDKITINGEIYRKAPECTDVISPGDTLTVKLNDANEIVAIDEAETSSYAVAWILNCATYNEDPLTTVSKIRVIDTDNEIREYTLAESGWVDGVRYKKNAAALSSEMNDAPVRYRLNKAGEVVEMDTVVQRAVNDKDCLVEAIPQSSSIEYSTSSRLLSSSSTGLTVGIMRENAKFINRFEDAKDPEDYSWVTTLSDEGMNCRAYSFDFSKGYIDIFVRNSRSTKRITSSAFVFEQIIPSLNEDGVVCNTVFGYGSGKEVSYVLSDKYPELEEQFKALKEGDFITVWTDNSGDLLGLTVIYFYGKPETRAYSFDGEEKELKALLHDANGIAQGKRAWYPHEKYVCGKVVDIDGQYLKLELKGTGETEILHTGRNSFIRYAPMSGDKKINSNLISSSVKIGDTVVSEIISKATRTVYVVD